MPAPTPRERTVLAKAISAQIRAERAAAKLTVEKTADLTKIPYGTLRKLDDGRGTANSDQLWALCSKAFNISLRTFFERVEDRLAAQQDGGAD